MKLMIKNMVRFVTMLLVVACGIAFFIVCACTGTWNRIGVIVAAIGVMFAGSFATHDIIPLKYNDKVIRYRKSEYSWDEVKVTLIYTHRIFHPTHYVYYLAFSDSFIYGDDVQKSVSSGFWVDLTFGNLDIVTQHYHDMIAVVGNNGSSIPVDKLLIDKRFKRKINEHNDKYFENLKEINGI